jgi:hypothetical protein
MRLFLLLILLMGPVHAETVDVRHYGPLDLAHLNCESVSRSSFIERVCYDKKERFLVIKLREIDYPYCGIDQANIDALMSADSMGRFYNASIKGKFDCQVNRAPKY